MEGRVSADLHRDFVISKPTLRFDGKTAIKDGEIL
jgi:leucyl aminopeptidase (aminopeptidase T)